MHPRELPGALRVRGREHLEATGGVDCHELALRRPHGGVEHIARTECLAASLTGAVARGDRVVARHVGLHRALVGLEQAVAHCETAYLVELHLLGGRHRSFLAALISIRTRQLSCRVEHSRRSIPNGDRPPCGQAHGRRRPGRDRGTAGARACRRGRPGHSRDRGLGHGAAPESCDDRRDACLRIGDRQRDIGRQDASEADGERPLDDYDFPDIADGFVKGLERERAEGGDTDDSDLDVPPSRSLVGDVLDRAEDRPQRYQHDVGIFDPIAVDQAARTPAEGFGELVGHRLDAPDGLELLGVGEETDFSERLGAQQGRRW